MAAEWFGARTTPMKVCTENRRRKMRQVIWFSWNVAISRNRAMTAIDSSFTAYPLLDRPPVRGPLYASLRLYGIGFLASDQVFQQRTIHLIDSSTIPLQRRQPPIGYNYISTRRSFFWAGDHGRLLAIKRIHCGGGTCW